MKFLEGGTAVVLMAGESGGAVAAMSLRMLPGPALYQTAGIRSQLN